MTNINDMFQASKDVETQDFADLLGPDQLANGQKVRAEIVFSKAGETKQGAPSWTNKLQVLDGDHKDGEFFDSIYLSAKTTDGALGYNKRQFAKIQATGLGEQFFSSNPSAEAIAKALVGKTVIVSIKWQAPNEDGRVFGEHTWGADDAAPAGGPAGFSAPAGFNS